MNFRILGLDAGLFSHLFGLADDALAARGVRRVIADTAVGYPDRIALRDAAPGERLLLLNYTHQPADTPYRASHAIFVAERAQERFDAVGVIPQMLRVRPISLRAFDADGEMTDADLVEGAHLEKAVARMLAARGTAYLHAHFAKRGCYACRVERVE
jgi:hypothetical protein